MVFLSAGTSGKPEFLLEKLGKKPKIGV